MGGLQFQSPWALALLAPVPLLALLYLLAEHRRARVALRYASAALVSAAVGRGPGRLRHVAPAAYLLFVSFAAVATARPAAVVTVPSNESTIVLAIDVSGSMRAQDVQPSRIEAAKAAAITFVEKKRAHPSVRIGIVAFAEEAFIVQPPTTDRDATNAAIARLQPQRGTAIGQAILTALDALVEEGEDELPSEHFARTRAAGARPVAPFGTRTFASAEIVLLTDGVNTRPPSPTEVIDEAVSRGVRIYTIGLGTTQGAAIPAQGGFGGGFGPGGGGFRARLDEATLKKVAEATDGEYFNAENAQDLTRIYDHLGSEVVFRRARTDISAAFAALAALAGLAGGAFSLRTFNRLP